MPDTTKNTLFSAEFDNTDFVKKTSEMVDALKAVDAATIQATTSLADLKTKLDASTQEVSKAKEGARQFTGASKDYTEEQKKQLQTLADLQAAHDKLFADYQTQGQQLAILAEKHRAATKAIQATAAAAKAVKDAVGNGVLDLKLNNNSINEELQKIKGTFNTLFSGSGVQGLFSGNEIEGFNTLLQNSETDFKKVAIAVEALKSKLAGLEPGTEEFNNLSKAVQVGNTVLEQYDKIVSDSVAAGQKQEGGYVSSRAKITALKNELIQLAEAGKENTKEYREMQIETAKLEQEYSDVQAQIKELASETRYLDFGVSAIRTAAAGYETFLGTFELFGAEIDKNGEAQKRLVAILNIVVGLQELQEMLNKNNKLLITGNAIATEALAGANAFLATSFGAAATAADAFKGALITTGIGALVVGIGYLIYKLIELKDSQEAAEIEQKTLNDIIAASGSEYQKAITNVERLTAEFELADKGLISQKQTLEDYNKTFGNTIGNADSLAQAEQFLIDKSSAYIEATFLKAVANEALNASAKKAFEAEQERAKNVSEFIGIGDKVSAGLGKATIAVDQALNYFSGGILGSPGSDRLNNIGNVIFYGQANKDKAVNDLQKGSDTAMDIYKDYSDRMKKVVEDNKLNLNGFIFDKGPGTTAKKPDDKPIVNEFEKRLQDLQIKLAALAEKAFTSDSTIKAKLQAEFAKSVSEISAAQTAGKLTGKQAEILQGLLIQISDAQFIQQKTALKNKLLEAAKEIEKTLDDYRNEAAKARVANIIDQFKRERQTIGNEAAEGLVSILSKRDAALKLLNDKFEIGVFGDPQSPKAQQKRDAAKTSILYETQVLINELNTGITNKLQLLGENVFIKNLENLKDSFDTKGQTISKDKSDAQNDAGKKYLAKQISFKQYTEAIKAIENESTINTLKNENAKLQAEQQRIDARIALKNVSPEEKDKLTKRTGEIQAQISANNAAITAGSVQQAKEEETVQGAKTAKFLDNYEMMFEAAANFYSAIAEMEQRNLDRSIALQNTRVDNARYIAERGNAEYLAIEEKRLDDLTRKQQAAAEKQIAIANAIAASQALVAVIKSIAEGGVFAPATFAAVIGLIAAGYKFVSALQPVQTSFYEGTPYVEQGRHKAGRDTIPARVNIGEAIIPTDTNSQYSEAVKAIYYKRIPANVLNEFVTSYSGNRLPTFDSGRLMAATEYKISDTVITNKKLDAVTEVLDSIDTTLMQFEQANIKMDETGFSVALMRKLRSENLKKRI